MVHESQNIQKVDLSHFYDKKDTVAVQQVMGQAAPSSVRRNVPLLSRVVAWSGGCITTETQAAYVVLAVVGVAIAGSVYVLVGTLHPPAPPPADQIIEVAGPGVGR